jgi:ribosome maturation factor RimP
MGRNRDIEAKLLKIAQPVCEDAGFEVVDIRFSRDPRGWVVQIFIDYSNGGAQEIGFDDCERMSRELSAVFDVEDPIPHAYSLEVSSPGVARPLRTAEHFRRFLGQQAKIALSDGIDGRRNFKGTLVAVDDDERVTVEVDGQSYDLPISDIDNAKLVPDWDAVMRNAGR